eukprot:CAMPEP_0172519084 /NCGR_PEP_ID=MMETSP1066-20121228/291205_1 /TAXON_ID=671091 /ORGANISM="Coscinodiscus wailesii, Strain CCMP2513" /LENGTH=76 /DNA_ID=CAMNT_0013301599 /DNA_START=1609 /DNA_END=1839 /DNA_ORIENTATION=-
MTRDFLSPVLSLVANCRASTFKHHQSSLGGSSSDSPQPVGRNCNADGISNKADVYSAQLKMEPHICKQAFLNGDTE